MKNRIYYWFDKTIFGHVINENNDIELCIELSTSIQNRSIIKNKFVNGQNLNVMNRRLTMMGTGEFRRDCNIYKGELKVNYLVVFLL